MLPVLFNPPSNPPSTQKLVDHIQRLSGVKVKVMTWDADPLWLERPGLQNEAFRYVARTVKEPFLWLEQDSIPLTKDWLTKIKDRWEECSADTMCLISTDRQTPHDLMGGIGVYRPEVGDHIPPVLLTRGFDEHIVNKTGLKIERTGLIQHSYGNYDIDGNAHPHKFPRDSWILRESSVIFHSDKTQSLIK